MGYTFRMQDDFSAIPGLKTWLDGRVNIQKDGSNFISLVGDLSGENNFFNQTLNIRKPVHEDNKWIKFLAQDGSNPCNLNSSRRDFRFIHNGSPFGYYGIINFEFPPPETPIGNYGFFQTGGASSTGMQFLFQNVTSGGRLVAIVRNEGTIVRSSTINNLSTVGNPNYTVFPQTLSMSSLFLGANITNNQVFRLGSLSATSTSTALVSAYASGDNKNFSLGLNPNMGYYLKTGVALIYDWTGYTESEILIFDSRVRGLINNILPAFI